jgi:hypothetical protein
MTRWRRGKTLPSRSRAPSFGDDRPADGHVVELDRLQVGGMF